MLSLCMGGSFQSFRKDEVCVCVATEIVYLGFCLSEPRLSGDWGYTSFFFFLGGATYPKRGRDGELLRFMTGSHTEPGILVN